MSNDSRMYKITYSIDGESKGQVLGLYMVKEAAQHNANFLPMAIDEDGNPYSLPIDPKVEEATLHDFARPHQGIVIRCQKCNGEINDKILPFPLLSNLASLTWQWVIDPDDFAHDAGCEFVIFGRIPLPPDDPD